MMKKMLLAVFAAALVSWAMTSASLRAADEKTTTTSAPASAPAPAKAAGLVVWDGEDNNKGQGWVSPKEEASIKAQGDMVHGGKQALAWAAKGDQYRGTGWNWCGWYPADAGTDISDSANLVFSIKVMGATKPAEFTVALACSSNGKSANTPTVNLTKYCAKAFDGEWHEVVIPLKELYGDKKEFDPKKAWEFDLGTWNQAGVDFVAYIDDIGFTK
jgi:hypothetical protein